MKTNQMETNQTKSLIQNLNVQNYTSLNSDGKFSNKKIMFTGGFQNMSRSEAKSIAETNGGKVLGAISKKLDILVVGDNGVGKTEPLTIFGEKNEELIDGNRTFLAGKGLKQVRGYKIRVIPDSFIEQVNVNQEEKELAAEGLNPRDEIRSDETDEETIYDRLQKNFDVNIIEFDSE